MSTKYKQFQKKLANSIKDQDEFSQSVTLNFNGEKTISSVCGGFFSLVIKFSLLYVFIYQSYIIFDFQIYNIWDTILYYDLDVNEHIIDIKELMEDFSFGFAYKKKPIDLIDNEFFRINMIYQIKWDEFNKDVEEVGIHECSETSHVAKLYNQRAIALKFGSLYCPNELKDHMKLQGTSQTGYPTKRVIFSL